MTAFRVVIPARYASTRLPGKPLMEIAGKPMLQHVYESALKSGAKSVVIATDDERIAQAAQVFQAEVCMTSAEHVSGTDRIAEAVVKLGYNPDDIIVNVQGDEPLMPAYVIAMTAENLAAHQEAAAATVCEPVASAAELFDPNVVKVVFDNQGYALYFSRAPIAWELKNFPPVAEQSIIDHYRHRGIYAYRVNFLLQFIKWPPSLLEKMESLEQLRILCHGKKIHVGMLTEKIPTDINTPEDLVRIQRYF